MLLPETAFPLIGRIAEKLMKQKLVMGTAESCTGGLVAALCTHVPGSSCWFYGGVVAYDNSVKQRLLAVPEEMIQCHGAVSSPVAEAMARGALDALGVDVAVSLSGIAGPGGGTSEKPVGTVWMGLAARHGAEITVSSFVEVFPGDRQEIRSGAAVRVLEALDIMLEEDF